MSSPLLTPPVRVLSRARVEFGAECSPRARGAAGREAGDGCEGARTSASPCRMRARSPGSRAKADGCERIGCGAGRGEALARSVEMELRNHPFRSVRMHGPSRTGRECWVSLRACLLSLALRADSTLSSALDTPRELLWASPSVSEGCRHGCRHAAAQRVGQAHAGCAVQGVAAARAGESVRAVSPPLGATRRHPLSALAATPRRAGWVGNSS